MELVKTQWRIGKFGLSRPYHAERSSFEELAPVSLTSCSTSDQAYDKSGMVSGEILSGAYYFRIFTNKRFNTF